MISSCVIASGSLLDPTLFFFFFFNDTATTEIYTLSLHDALPISWASRCATPPAGQPSSPGTPPQAGPRAPSQAVRASCPTAWDRESTRLNSSHPVNSYAVFCLKKKKIQEQCIIIQTITHLPYLHR